jgi:hypothetical protein
MGLSLRYSLMHAGRLAAGPIRREHEAISPKWSNRIILPIWGGGGGGPLTGKSPERGQKGIPVTTARGFYITRGGIILIE